MSAFVEEDPEVVVVPEAVLEAVEVLDDVAVEPREPKADGLS